MQLLPMSCGDTCGSLRSAFTGASRGIFTSTSSCIARLFLDRFQLTQFRGARTSGTAGPSARLPRIGWLYIAFDSPETRSSELADTSSFGQSALPAGLRHSIRRAGLGWYSREVGFYPTHAPVAQRIEQLTTDQ